MLSYAVRFKIDKIALFYPVTVQNYQRDAAGITIRDEFADQIDVKVTAWQLPVINRELMNRDFRIEDKSGKTFEGTKNVLKERIQKILFAHILKQSG